MPLWPGGKFELETIKAQKTQEELFIPPFNCLKGFWWRAWPRKIAITGDHYKECGLGVGSCRGAQQGRLFQVPSVSHCLCMAGRTLASPSPCKSPSSPLKSQVPAPSLSSGWSISLNCLTACGSHLFMCHHPPPIHIIKCVFIPLNCLMLTWLSDQRT